jgi:hypothetical protein
MSTPSSPSLDSQPDWTSKTLAGLVMGLALAFAGAALMHHLAPPGASKMLVVVWLVTPLWLIVQSTVYLFRSGRRAWLWLGGLTVAAYVIVFFADLVSP